jgi:hypothetical protein
MGPGTLLVFVGIVAVVVHSVVLYFAWSHTALSAAAVSGAIVLILIKHLGVLGPLYALFRRGSRKSR